MLRVLLADDQAYLRSAIRLLLEQEGDVEVIAEAADLKSLLSKAQVTTPDLILLDWELPGLESANAGHHTLVTLHDSVQRVHIVVLSGRPEAGHEALIAGADYFVSKASPPEALLNVIGQIKAKG